MTREEAIDYIREWCPYDRQEEIIKALEQEPCEDAVSRQAVLQIFNEWFACCDIADKKASPKNKIKALPSVTPARKKWKWIIDGHHLICPRCEIHFCREDREGDELPNNYCPNCGADMREVEE